MKQERTLLVSSAGRRVALQRCFREDAEHLGIPLKVVAADLKPEWSAACADADHAVKAPPCRSPEFIDAMLAICSDYAVDLIVPTIDTELLAYSEARERFAAIGTTVAVSAPSVVAMARDKLRTARFLGDHGLPTPRTATPPEVAAEPGAWQGALMLKPRGGSSSIGIRRLASVDDMPDPSTLDDYVVQELWEGSEYTINMFFDADGACRAAVPHLRLEVRAGEVSKGITSRLPALTSIARKFGEALPDARGALCFQAIVDGEGGSVVFELNARFGGGYPLAHRAGARFSQWLLEEISGLPSSGHDDWQDGVKMLRYDDAVFSI